eukprot:TRINITY_DN6289_c1_g1_i1.p1 TRINITY_DN6289_c1_g1~~TRINITY_DN6289_c1_g1_i1.p1  ORF type:complete len:216 (-),score=9.31 TRINITY_DN6289_c1_g1_i1:338-985(-)
MYRNERFCQKCSKFQSLKKFDNIKRTCRERLVRHNQLRKTKYHSKKKQNTVLKAKKHERAEKQAQKSLQDYQEKVAETNSLEGQASSRDVGTLNRNSSFESGSNSFILGNLDKIIDYENQSNKDSTLYNPTEEIMQFQQQKEIFDLQICQNVHSANFNTIGELEFGDLNDGLDQILRAPMNDIDGFAINTINNNVDQNLSNCLCKFSLGQLQYIL